MFAATYPERTPALVLYGTFSCRRSRCSHTGRTRLSNSNSTSWRGAGVRPSTATSCFEPTPVQGRRRRLPPLVRDQAAPRREPGGGRHSDENGHGDGRSNRPAVDSRAVPDRAPRRRPYLRRQRCPVSGRRDPWRPHVELPGEDHLPWVGESEAIVGEIEQFLTGIWQEGGWEEREPERVLSTVLFTDIIGSSEHAASLGDRAWRELLEKHHALVRSQLVRFRGREMDTAGDGFFASFDGPARAIRCAPSSRACASSRSKCGPGCTPGSANSSTGRWQYRRAHRSAYCFAGSAWRGAGIEHGQGSRRRLRNGIPGARA